MLFKSNYVSSIKEIKVGQGSTWKHQGREKKNEKKESTFKHYSREIVLNVAVTAEGKALSGMAMVPSTLGMKYMVNSDISVIGKKEKITEPRAQATCKTWPWVT